MCKCRKKGHNKAFGSINWVENVLINKWQQIIVVQLLLLLNSMFIIIHSLFSKWMKMLEIYNCIAISYLIKRVPSYLLILVILISMLSIKYLCTKINLNISKTFRFKTKNWRNNSSPANFVNCFVDKLYLTERNCYNL